jgi:hypothetical protein
MNILKIRSTKSLTVVLLTIATLFAQQASVAAPPVRPHKNLDITFGSNSRDATTSSVAVNGGVVVIGVTEGNLFSSSLGERDAWISKISSNGVRIWSRQFGTSARDTVTGLVETAKGDLYVVGYSEGSFSGEQVYGHSDGFLANLDSNGNLKWIKRFGTALFDITNEMRIDSASKILVAGANQVDINGTSSSSSLLTILNLEGTQERVIYLNSGVSAEATDVAFSSNNDIFLTGFVATTYSSDSFPLSVGFVQKLTQDYNLVWSKPVVFEGLGTIPVSITDEVAGTLYVSGWTEPLNSESLFLEQGTSGWIQSVEARTGNLNWSRTLTSNKPVLCTQLFVVPGKAVGVVGWTQGTLFDLVSGLSDPFVQIYSFKGESISSTQLKMPGSQAGISVVQGAGKTIVILGLTKPENGEADIFVKTAK